MEPKIYLIVGIVFLAIFILIARLAIRWFVRLLIIGIILVALLGGSVFWWWTKRLAPPPQSRPRPAPTRRAAPQ
jgi:hypothetical protein